VYPLPGTFYYLAVEILNSRQDLYKGLGIYNTDFEAALAQDFWHRKKTLGMGIAETSLALHATLGMRDNFLKPLREVFDTYINFFPMDRETSIPPTTRPHTKTSEAPHLLFQGHR